MGVAAPALQLGDGADAVFPAARDQHELPLAGLFEHLRGYEVEFE